MSLPSKKAIQIDENTVDYEYKMLNHVMQLRYHEDKCVECGFCTRVCPVTISIYDEPLKKTAIGTPKFMNIESDKKIVVDVEKCSFCGSCSWICPGYTLELYINSEKKILLVENGSLPEFEEEVRELETGQKVRKVVEGSINITSTEKDTKILDAFTD
jgi:formate hydrogenlyase subunit 6/NADH:ubiquinone oxidoreductase subunit I